MHIEKQVNKGNTKPEGKWKCRNFSVILHVRFMRKLNLSGFVPTAVFLLSGDFHRKHGPVLWGKMGVWLIPVSWASVMTPALSLRPSCWGRLLITFHQNEISTADLCYSLLYPANHKSVYPYLTRMAWDGTAQLLPGERYSTSSCYVHLNTSLYIIYLDLSYIYTYICQ